MTDLHAKPAVLTAVIQIKRKATGKVEEYVLTGTVEQDDGSDSSNGIPELGGGPRDEHAVDDGKAEIPTRRDGR